MACDKFVDEFLQNENKVSKYNFYYKLSSMDALLLIILGIFIAISIPIFTITDQYNLEVGDDTILYTSIFILSVALASVSNFIWRKELEKNPLDERTVAYHYLAKAISVYQDEEQDVETVVSCLTEFQGFVNRKNIQLLHGKRENQFQDYINKAEEFSNGDGNLEKFLDSSFENNMTLITEEIIRNENSESLLFPEISEDQERNWVTWAVYPLLRTISSTKSYYSVTIGIILLSIVVGIFFDLQLALFIATVLLILQNLIQFQSESE